MNHTCNTENPFGNSPKYSPGQFLWNLIFEHATISVLKLKSTVKPEYPDTKLFSRISFELVGIY